MNFPHYIGAIAPPVPELDDLAGPIRRDHRTLSLDEGYPLRLIFQTAVRRLGLPQDHQFAIVRFDGQRNFLDSPEEQAALNLEIAETDHRTHLEAKTVPGYVVYSPGELDEDGQATSWCGWLAWTAARQARTMTYHMEGMSQTNRFYQWINFSRFILRLDDRQSSGVNLQQLHDNSRQSPAIQTSARQTSGSGSTAAA